MSTPLQTSWARTPKSRASRSTHGCETQSDVVGLDDRAVLAVDQRRRGEVVDVVHGADHVVDDAVVAQLERGVGRQAVLRVHDVVAARARIGRRPSA